ncbi:hypothetical protein FHR81_003023 [Actinoalloteichus hoggarensis]|uniref:Uncharacterized protein n=1 Tax=Actinoalloteichus hoggarensis TaxID=1470176 RepID=A0A221VYK3_9PSEU|nr:hypothetical protein [Actinoalloteichus hoggarensis]ASO18616.1 hypothetical protein AHOG_04810 [Actinoalloteichus hoggarensis]MBB5921983.1 hypothetical protein [Actinoalloteichus hoggarensis]
MLIGDDETAMPNGAGEHDGDEPRAVGTSVPECAQACEQLSDIAQSHFPSTADDGPLRTRSIQDIAECAFPRSSDRSRLGVEPAEQITQPLCLTCAISSFRVPLCGLPHASPPGNRRAAYANC